MKRLFISLSPVYKTNLGICLSKQYVVETMLFQFRAEALHIFLLLLELCLSYKSKSNWLLQDGGQQSSISQVDRDEVPDIWEAHTELRY